MQKITLGTLCKNSYEKFKNHPFHGMYMFLTPTLMVNDPELIKLILVKDFPHFVDRGIYSNEKADPLTCNLFQIYGEKWKTIRTKCSVFFTSSKLKNIFPILSEIADEAIKVSNETLENTDVMEIKDLMERYFVDTIFSIAFGAKAGTIRDPQNIFRYYGNLSQMMRPVHLALSFYAPHLIDFFRIPFIHPKASKFLIRLFKDMIEKRKREEEKRKDFLDVLIDLIHNEQTIGKDNEDTFLKDLGEDKVSRKLTVLEATAQAFVFFIAGFETSTSTVSFALHELAANPEIQDNLHKEIDEFLQSSESLNFENLMNLKYLDMVFNETLRKHPVIPVLNRICVKDYQIPNCNYCIPKGMRIIIPVSGIHRDSKYYPDPEKFDPTRFNKENSAPRHPGTYYLPFGIGPRYCIGKRLGVFQSKLILFVLLTNYKFFTCEKTQPLSYKINHFLQTPKSEWKIIKAKCSVLFTSSKLKQLFPILTDIADEAINVSNENLANSDILELKDFLARIFTDMISSIIFGINSHSVRDPNNIFRQYGKLIIKAQPLILTLASFTPNILDILHIPFIDPKASKFLKKLIEDLIEKRHLEKEKRSDFLNRLIDLMETDQVVDNEDEESLINDIGEKNASRKLTVMEATAQAFVFFLAGFQNTSSTVSFSLYELAVNPDIQENLYNEIDEFLQSSETFNFDNLMKLKYLDMVLNETLRKHALLSILNRICVKDYQIPNSNYCIPKGMRIIIPVSGIHHDPNYYPDPEKFDPTRFSKENSADRHPATYLSFGIGPRYCFGKRLGLFQAKLILVIFLSHYKFSLSDKMSTPLRYSLNTFVQTPNGEVYLRIQKRNGINHS
ncbi:PREDICTED: cytochrome P450 6a8-like [Ceratosolen solmsi marchali]|uniref:Cytochrome P450 6a8-like n=3 Tax=Ceratosolen solmsi marchali TaxID=326594 RepID=A0AAJ6VJY5_9HYME|nr:PREDICTED: cytochrome P450 6a8-like [Ceratosolen solmsi marchali]